MKKLPLIKHVLWVWMIIPILSNAQTRGDANPQKVDDFKLEFHYSDEALAIQAKMDNETSVQQHAANSFAATNPQWNLTNVQVEKAALGINAANYNLLLDEAKASFTNDIIYVESAKKALFAKQGNELTPIYFGKTTQNNSNVQLHHQTPGCSTCSKTISFTKRIDGNTMVIRMGAEDEDKSDVFYLLTFNK